MNAENLDDDTCRNEGCFRLAEPGEPYCATCGLERSLYDRDARLRRAQDSARSSREERRA